MEEQKQHPSVAPATEEGVVTNDTESMPPSVIVEIEKQQEKEKDIAEEKVEPECVLNSAVTTDRIIVLLEGAGGTDKNEHGHRRDTIPIQRAIEKHGATCVIVQYQEEYGVDLYKNNKARAENDALASMLKEGRVAGLIMRNNPGTLSSRTQAKLDALVCGLNDMGVKVMSHPEVQKRMGAKDSLTKIRHLRCGLDDTEVYYDAEGFRGGFRKSIAFRPRVIKQNRGSQGEGIWICKLKDESQYCEEFGDRVADLDEMLVLMEANDNHVEEHTVGEFVEFCINGRTEAAGIDWQSTGEGKYLEGGAESGSMLVDQRFLPRIVEGEVRCMMVGKNLVELIHKKPREGGLSATLQSGAIYTKYTPDAPEFINLVKNFEYDLPYVMSAFGIEDQPLPLLWTADYILGDKLQDGSDTFYVGEFNCACVGITQQLYQADIVGKTAVETCFGTSMACENSAPIPVPTSQSLEDVVKVLSHLDKFSTIRFAVTLMIPLWIVQMVRRVGAAK